MKRKRWSLKRASKKDLERRLGITLNKLSIPDLKRVIISINEIKGIDEYGVMVIGANFDLQTIGDELFRRKIPVAKINKLLNIGFTK